MTPLKWAIILAPILIGVSSVLLVSRFGQKKPGPPPSAPEERNRSDQPGTES